ncbi:hypothetical protein GQ53DRAFT_743139 [Thozetella sp. PMI_491]|nr:hypothetical protein GQ53DRAFT_743139 [Thozetella sp. PMI_491]
MQVQNLFSLLLAFFLCLSPATVIATGCNGCGSPCGSVTNNSGKTMLYTTNPNPNGDLKNGSCRFWNWYESDKVLQLIPHDKLVACTQQSLTGGAGKKGGWKQNIDVDGFTFSNDAYWIGARRVGAGVWTKFPDIVDVTCRRVPVVGSILCTLV